MNYTLDAFSATARVPTVGNSSPHSLPNVTVSFGAATMDQFATCITAINQRKEVFCSKVASIQIEGHKTQNAVNLNDHHRNTQ